MFDGRDMSADLMVAFALSAGVLVILSLTRQKGDKAKGKRYPPSLSLLTLIRPVLNGGMSVLPKHFMKMAEKLGPIFSFKVGNR